MEKTKGKFITVGLTCLLLLSSITVPVIACPPDPPPISSGWPVNNPSNGAEPIYLKNGEYHFSSRDLLIRGRVLPVQIVRTYGSREGAKPGLGHAWDMNYNLRVVERDDFTVILSDGEHRELEYTKLPGTPKYTAPPGLYDYIKKMIDETYMLYKKHGTKFHFDSYGRLDQIIDRHGNTVEFSYTDGLLTTIRDDLDRTITLSYNSNDLLETITDSEDRTWTYGYDTNRDLLSITGPATAEHPSGLTTTYTYDGYHNLLTATDPADQTYLTNSYTDDWVTSQTYGTGTFTVDYSPGTNSATVTNRKGYDTKIVYNSTGNPTHLTTYTDNLRLDDPLSYTTLYAYNSDMEITRKTFPKGNCIDYTYDTTGNILGIYRKTNPDEPQNPSDPDVIGMTYTYEENFNFVKEVTSPRGHVTTCTYDYEEPSYGTEVGNLMKITFPAVSVYGQQDPIHPEVSFTYNSLGQLVTVTAPDGIVTKFEYHDNPGNPDNYGRLWRVIRDFGTGPALNMTTEFAYDALGRVRAVEDPGGNITEFTHNNLDQLKQIEAPSPFYYLTKFSYNENKKLSKVQAQLGPTFNSATAQTTEFTYEILDHLKKITNPLGKDTGFWYDNSENPYWVEDAEYNDTVYYHDERNLLWKTWDVRNGVWSDTEYSYDDNGNLRKIEDAKDQITAYDYDDFDRLETITYHDNTTEVFSYDKSSNVHSWKNRKNETITYQYDALNRLTSKTWPNSERVITYAYDIVGRLVVVSDSGGPGARYWYDRLGRVTSVSQGYGAPGSKTIGYQYDAMGRRQRLTYPDGSYITYHYDELSRLTYIKDQGINVIARYTYDELSRRKQVEYNPIETTADYDYVDKVEANNDNFGNMLENLTTDIGHSATKTFDYTYDDVGNRLTMKVDDADTHSYSYDNVYQLINADYNGGSITSYYYDSLGNRTSVVDGDGVVGYWKMDDNADNTTVVDSSGNGYNGTFNDAGGNPNTSAHHTDGKIGGALTFDGDDYVSLSSIAALTGNTVTISAWIWADTIDSYDPILVQWNLTDEGYYFCLIDGKPQIWIGTYHAESPTAIGTTDWHHITGTYDGLNLKIYVDGVLKDTSDAPDKTGYNTNAYIGWSGTSPHFHGKIDNVMIFDSALPHTEYSRNSLNQYTSVGGTDYSYDDNGNLVNINNGQYEYAYDYENRLTEAKNNSQTVGTYSYDFAGRRITKTANSTTTKYYYDGGQVIAEYEGDTLVRKFIYGPGIDEPICMIDVTDNNARYYYHYDALGSVVALINAAGYVCESYTYDVFGQPVTTSSIGNPYMFTGRRYDPETALYYYRFRYYKPDIGRFLQTDPIHYAAGLNLYTYVRNNPANFLDPLGLLLIPITPIEPIFPPIGPIVPSPGDPISPIGFPGFPFPGGIGGMPGIDPRKLPPVGPKPGGPPHGPHKPPPSRKYIPYSPPGVTDPEDLPHVRDAEDPGYPPTSRRRLRKPVPPPVPGMPGPPSLGPSPPIIIIPIFLLPIEFWPEEYRQWYYGQQRQKWLMR